MYNLCVISPHLLFQKLRRLFQRDAGARRAAKAAGEPAAGRRPFCGAAILRSGIRQPFQVSQPQERGVAPPSKTNKRRVSPVDAFNQISARKFLFGVTVQ